MATIHPYNPDIFHSLQSPGDAAQDFSSHDIKLLLHRGSELSQLFLNHKVGTDIAIELLHRHFEVPADKRLVRVGRVVTPWSTSLFSAVEQQSGLGRLAPSGILVRDGAYYPYEFRHLSKAEDEAEAQSSGGKGRLVQHAAFLEQFALFVQDKGISHVLGLRTLSAEEKRRVEDPAIHDYEVTDDGYHMTVLSTDAPMEVMVSDEFSWALPPLSGPVTGELSALGTQLSCNGVRDEIFALERAINRKPNSILNRMEPLLSVIEHYSEVASIFVQVNQSVLAPVWGSIRLLVVVLRSYATYVDEVLAYLEVIQRNMPRYSEYVNRYPDRKRLSDAVAHMLDSVAKFCDQARHALVRREDATLWGRLKQQTRPARRPFASAFKPTLDRITELRAQIEHEAQSAVGASVEVVKADGKQAKDLQVKALHLAMAALNETSSAHRLRDLADIRQYLHEADLANKARLKTLNSCCSKYSDTCGWIIDKPQFQSWSSHDRGLLLVHGPAGCGKTVLAAMCVEKCRNEKTPDSRPFFFFCDEGSPGRRSWESVLHAWAVNLTSRPHTPELFDQLRSVVAEAKKGNSLAVTVNMLRCGFDVSKPTVVLDGLDELRDVDHEEAIRDLCDFARRTRILVFFRSDSKILKAFETARDVTEEGVPALSSESIAIRKEDTQEDITRVVEKWVKRREITGPVAAKVRESVVGGAHGMFLWVHFMLQELKHCETEDEFGRALDVILPGGIGGYYDRFIDRALSKCSSRYQPAFRALQLIAFSIDTLSLDTVDVALRFHFRDRSGAVPETRRLLLIFSPLIRLEPNTRIIHAIHASVMDHLRACKTLAPVEACFPDHNPEHANHAAIFRLCIEFLTSVVQSEETTDKWVAVLKTKHSFLEYAARHVWTHLCRSGPATEGGLDLLNVFFEAASKNSRWIELTALLGMDYRVRDRMVIQSSLRMWLKTCSHRLRSPDNDDRIKRVEDGVLSLYQGAVKYCITKYAADDIRIARSVYALGSFLYQQSQLAEAVGHLKHAVSRYENPQQRRNYEDGDYDYKLDPEYHALLSELADCLNDIEPQNRGVPELMARAHKGSLAVYGNKHPTTIYYAVMLAEMYSCLGELDRAIALFLQTLDTAMSALGERDPVTMRAHHNLGKAYLTRGDYAAAERHIATAEKWRRKVLGGKHPTTLRSMTILGEVHLQVGRYDEAWRLIRESRAGLAEARGPDSIYVHLATQSLGDVRLRQGRFSDAITLYNEAKLGLMRASGNAETSGIAGIMDKLSKAFDANGDMQRANRFRKEAYLIRSKAAKAGQASLSKQRLLRVLLLLLLLFLHCGGLLLATVYI
ncbi:hypothetical protein QBC43DRAFT_286325 [Cladorrhinum sp. PSN259]|nr:hypothetical protein QBC43DRAFT_286325 [Cladorrhinum sp. PSN259]